MLKRLLRQMLRAPGAAGLIARGRAERERGELAESLQTLLAAPEGLAAGSAELQDELGLTYRALQRSADARACFERSARVAPDRAAAHAFLGNLDYESGAFEQAAADYAAALSAEPRNAAILYNHALALLACADASGAMAQLRRALACDPDYCEAHSALLFASNLMPGADAEEVAREHFAWARRYTAKIAGASGDYGNPRDPARRIKLGYVSADFRAHALASLFEPVLNRHDHANFEVFCYDNGAAEDEVTHRLRASADHWTRINQMDDATAAGRIREAGIDILVDLSGHTSGNRLLLFARRPAPIEATWLGYVQTTGMAQIDYRITDARVDPPGLNEKLHAEGLLRLPNYLSCFRPDPASPEVNPLPALKNGFLTFASFNNFVKVNSGVVQLWARLLQAIPDARLVVAARGGEQAQVRERILARFAEAGAPVEHIGIAGMRPLGDFLRLHHEVDVALDTFPYSGGTTTLHGLWMGVPVISAPGVMPISRCGASMLGALGLGEFIAADGGAYIDIALRCAADPAWLGEIRAGLRERMQSSPLMNYGSFTLALERLYRKIWIDWVAQHPSPD